MARNLFLLIFLSNLAFCLDEFIFWAKLGVDNSIVKTNNINISKAMYKKRKAKIAYLCDIAVQKAQNQSAQDFLNLHADALFECFAKRKVTVSQSTQTLNLKAQDQTNILIHPINFMVDFKPKSAIIYTFLN